jgi:hypothetical protein
MESNHPTPSPVSTQGNATESTTTTTMADKVFVPVLVAMNTQVSAVFESQQALSEQLAGMTLCKRRVDGVLGMCNINLFCSA